jgi:hypothetical protein
MKNEPCCGTSNMAMEIAPPPTIRNNIETMSNLLGDCIGVAESIEGNLFGLYPDPENVKAYEDSIEGNITRLRDGLEGLFKTLVSISEKL